MTDSSASKPKLLDQVRAVIRTKHLSKSTEESYINWIKRFILFHNKQHPKQMGEKEISEFLTHLAVEERVAASTQNSPREIRFRFHDDILLCLYSSFLKRLIKELSHGVKALCAIVFLYKHVLKIELGYFGDIAWAKKRDREPVVFTQNEVKAVLNQLSGMNWIMSYIPSFIRYSLITGWK